jgi:hypothetical protein
VRRSLFSAAIRGGYLVLATSTAVLFACLARAGEPKQNAADAETTASRLVRAALEKELAGQNDQRDARLREALGQSPGDAPAHWQLGQVRINGQWQSTSEVAEAARQDKRLAEYARRRDAAGPVAADQIALARWCRKNHLDDQQRVHWMWVLQLQPDNAEAIQALGLRPYRGMMLTERQIDELRAQGQGVRKAMDRWRPLVAQWSRAAHDPSPPAVVRERLTKISDGAQMAGLEGALWRQVGVKRQQRQYHDMLLAMVRALGDNPHPVAAESLVRSAVFSESKDVAAAAVAGLKRHPLDHYAPLLLSGLQSPVEACMQCSLSASGDLVTRYSIFQEGALADVSRSLMLAPVYADAGPDLSSLVPPAVSVAPGTGTVQFAGPQAQQFFTRTNPGLVAAAYAQAKADAAAAPRAAATASAAAAAQNNAANSAAAAMNYQINAQNAQAQARQNDAVLGDAVDRVNRAIAQRNARIEAALCQTTGLDLGEEPAKWWRWWWRDYNESYNLGGTADASDENPPYDKPQYDYQTYVEYPGSGPTYVPGGPTGPGTVGGPIVLSRPGPCSCFAPGTEVWTLTGRRPIEKIRGGDRVLAQDVESGELAYKPVLAVTLRLPGPRMRIGLGSQTITATPSHPFWVDGQGWRMTKQLEVGHCLHTLSGGLPVESIEKLPADHSYAGFAYNLIVADFSSYFVGQGGILVHDNTPRRPTAALVPGLVKRSLDE